MGPHRTRRRGRPGIPRRARRHAALDRGTGRSAPIPNTQRIELVGRHQGPRTVHAQSHDEPGKRRRAASVHAEDEQGLAHAITAFSRAHFHTHALHIGHYLNGQPRRRVRHVECRGWRIIGRRARDSGPASAASDRGAAAALPVPDRRQPVLHELGAVGLRARGTSRRPFRGRRHGVVSASPAPRRWSGPSSRPLAERLRRTVRHPSRADVRGDGDRRRAVWLQVHLADVSSDDWMLDARSADSTPMLARTGVVVPVSAYGRPVTHQAWNTFRQQTGIPVVIDGAASFEAIERRGEPVWCRNFRSPSVSMRRRPSARAKADASSRPTRAGRVGTRAR